MIAIIHRLINTALIVAIGYFLWSTTCEKDLHSCEVILFEELVDE